MATQQVNERLAALTAAGTSVWLDQIKRALIATGELQRLVEEDSLRGVTSNPTIFNATTTAAAPTASCPSRSIPTSPSTRGARWSRHASTGTASTART